MNKFIQLLLVMSFTVSISVNSAAESEHHEEHGHRSKITTHDNEGEHEGEHEEKGVLLTVTQMSLANITVTTLKKTQLNEEIYAPGEFKANGYTSYVVAPRTASIVLARHVALGDHVKKRQALVTLFSESVADGQAAYRVAQAEWRRVEKLGRQTVGDKRFISAETNYEATRGRLKAYGLSDKAISAVLGDGLALGEYTLEAVIDGSVLSDDFHQGQRIDAGASLMELANENDLWVEARLAPNMNFDLPSGMKAKIKVNGQIFEGEVAQEAHTIDPITRTRVVRLLVSNGQHRLHPGMFADVFFQIFTQTPVLAVPEDALIRSADGDWTIFIEDHPGEFVAEEVEIGRSFGQWREIKGPQPGSRVVTSGAFFIASQIAKGGFDPHNH